MKDKRTINAFEKAKLQHENMTSINESVNPFSENEDVFRRADSYLSS